ncbi:hypothetical protein ABTF01_20635, partial [Acinetobacter baumannii]
LVDKNHIVQKARYSGTQTLTETALLEGLCPLLENKPILECSDHAVMELEHSLRDHSMPPPVPGLLMLENCDSAFMMPLHLVRQLL